MITPRLLLAPLLLPLLLVGCDDREGLLEPQGRTLANALVGGSYELTVSNGTDLGGGQWQVSVLPAVLVAHVAFPDGTPVTKGTAVWQISVNGRWDRLGATPVNQIGTATFAPGIALPATLRFKYTGQGSGVKNGVSNVIAVRR